MTPREPDRASPGLPRAVVLLGAAAAAVVILAGMQVSAWLLSPVFLAMVVVIAASPLSQWLRRKGWPDWLATTALIIVVYATIAILVLTIGVSVARLASLLPTYADSANDILQNVADTLSRFGVGPDQIRHAASSMDFSKLAAAVESLLSAATSLASNLVFLLSMLLFLSFETRYVSARRARIAADRPAMNEALEGFIHNTRRYLIVTTVFGLIVAVLDVVGLWILGIPLAVLWGVLAFLTNYIPNVGFIIGLLPPALLGLLEGGWGLMIAVIAVYGGLNFVLQSLVQPRFIGDAVGLSSTVTFLSLILWSWVLGPIGAILAVPLTLLVKAILVDSDPKAGWVDAMIGSIPRAKKEPRERLYRRAAVSLARRRLRTPRRGHAHSTGT
ncbi:MAG TPA: AI-2E family transporter [Actinophytocola sp.]|uniref:AI-2E family transporter n=1 Tax=Actinophytocola sp. TaxID=1872138 RepID=UPI002F940CEF